VRSPLTLAERGRLDLLGDQPDRAAVLARLIRRLRPDIVHSLEFQHAGYIVLAARERLRGDEMPIWIASNYGSDISLFGHLPEHRARIRALLAAVDVHLCECARDLRLGREFGFTGMEAPLIPVGGGWDLDAAAVYRAPGSTSRRRVIALKSYEGWAGRAGVALEALRRCGDLLAGYALVLYLASHEFGERAARMTAGTGLRVEHAGGRPGWVNYEQMLALHGRARVSIGLSIADGISTSLLEAMLMGSFPIQSHTACADEWIADGVSGLLVHPEDPQPLAHAIRRALTDDDLVDQAAAINAGAIAERLRYRDVRETIIGMYERALALRTGRNE
jgi:glycosyltransferase involved in cell wall biosynthesis